MTIKVEVISKTYKPDFFWYVVNKKYVGITNWKEV